MWRKPISFTTLKTACCVVEINLMKIKNCMCLCNTYQFEYTQLFPYSTTAGFQLLPKDQLERLLVEQIADIEYQNFCSSMERLIASPYSYKTKEFIERFLKPLMDQSKQLEVPKPKIDEQGRQYVTTYECLRKTARADVTVRMPGTGKITINGQDITYFSLEECREQVSVK